MTLTIILFVLLFAVVVYGVIEDTKAAKENARLNEPLALPKSKNSIESLYRESVAKGKATKKIKKVKKVKTVEEVAKEIANK